MDVASFNKFRRIIYEKSGISLGPGKKSLVSSRISRRMRILGIYDSRDYLEYVIKDHTGDEIIQLLDVISTNVTHFFRQPDHYEFLSSLFTEWLNEGQRKFRFWSAACSTGEEPYSIAMKLLESTNGEKVDLKILATDISLNVLQKAVQGNYHVEKMSNLPDEIIKKFFKQTQTSGEMNYEIMKQVKDLVLFKRLNLSNPPFPMRGPFDAIFCCNVLIYFDDSVRVKLLKHIKQLLKSGGYLFVGYSENISHLTKDFESVRPSVYKKIDHNNGNV